MARHARSLLVALAAALALTLASVAPAAAAKPLPKAGCDLVDQQKVDALLGVATGAPVEEPIADGVGCSLPIPYDAATCTVQPEPNVAVGAREESEPLDLADAASQISDGGYDVRPLKGKAYGKKGAFLASVNGWTFFGAKGPYSVQVQVFEPCGSVSEAKVIAAAQALAKRTVKQL